MRRQMQDDDFSVHIVVKNIECTGVASHRGSLLEFIVLKCFRLLNSIRLSYSTAMVNIDISVVVLEFCARKKPFEASIEMDTSLRVRK